MAVHGVFEELKESVSGYWYIISEHQEVRPVFLSFLLKKKIKVNE